jgi:hypothetical protein
VRADYERNMAHTFLLSKEVPDIEVIVFDFRMDIYL